MHIPCEEIRTQTLVPVCASGCYQPTWFRDHIWCHHHLISMSDSSNLNPLFAGRAPRASTKWHFRLWFIPQSLTLPCLLLPLVWIWHLGFTVLGSNPGPHPNNASTLPTELYPQPVANIKSPKGCTWWTIPSTLSSIQRAVQPWYGGDVLWQDRALPWQKYCSNSAHV